MERLSKFWYGRPMNQGYQLPLNSARLLRQDLWVRVSACLIIYRNWKYDLILMGWHFFLIIGNYAVKGEGVDCIDGFANLCDARDRA